MDGYRCSVRFDDPLVNADLAIDVFNSKSGGATVASHKLVGPIDIAHVVHDTESIVASDPVNAIHEGGDSAHEAPNLISGALGTATEILASKLGHIEGPPESIVDVLEVCNECLGISTIPMDSDGVNMATGTLGNEL